MATINAAIVAIARAFAERGIKDGVQVNSVLPGPVLTNRRKTYMEKYAPAHNMTFEEAMEKFPAQTRIDRYGQPEEIAELMAFLVSPQAKWMTGSAVRMDGARSKGSDPDHENPCPDHENIQLPNEHRHIQWAFITIRPKEIYEQQAILIFSNVDGNLHKI